MKIRETLFATFFCSLLLVSQVANASKSSEDFHSCEGLKDENTENNSTKDKARKGGQVYILNTIVDPMDHDFQLTPLGAFVVGFVGIILGSLLLKLMVKVYLVYLKNYYKGTYKPAQEAYLQNKS